MFLTRVGESGILTRLSSGRRRREGGPKRDAFGNILSKKLEKSLKKPLTKGDGSDIITKLSTTEDGDRSLKIEQQRCTKKDSENSFEFF